jgi:peptidoglycan/LPS O-acetylase OafA/YrhL
LAWVPIVPIQHFWFILALMAGTAALSLLRTASQLLAAVGLCVGLSYGLSAAGADQILGALAIYLQSLPYILIGGWLRQSGARPVVTLAIALVSLIAFSAAVWWATLAGTTLATLAGLPITLAGCYAAYAAGTFATRSHWLSSALTMLGQHSYVIYLLHVITGAGARIALGKLAPGLNVAVAVLISLAAAIVLPVLFERIVRKLGLATLLGLDPLSFRISARKEAPAA